VDLKGDHSTIHNFGSRGMKPATFELDDAPLIGHGEKFE
jgi:hypothetical protein